MPALKAVSVFLYLGRTLSCLGISAVLAISAYAAPTVTVIAPKGGTSVGSPIFYEAFATSPACAKGIAAMRIYTVNRISAYTVAGAHLALSLVSSGTRLGPNRR